MKISIATCLLACSLWGQQRFTPVDDAGFQKMLAAHKGRVVLASFWATWCVPCRKEMPDLVKLSQNLSARGFDLVMISADEADREAAALQLLKDNQVPGAPYWLHAPDHDKFYNSVDSRWSDGSLPALFLYDRSGKKARSFIGETPVADLEAAIAKLL